MVLKRVLVVDDEQNILVTLKGTLEDEGYVVETAHSAETGMDRVRKFAPDLVLLDIWLPDEDGVKVLERIRKLDPLIQVVMMSGHGTVETAVRAIKLGAFDYLEKPIHIEKLLVLLKHVFEMKELESENRYLREELGEEESVVAESGAMQKLEKLVEVTGPSNGWVLIQGENGVGKELVARALHSRSERARKRFVAVNCAAIPDDLIESELFGHERGAFTGAVERRIGKFEQADGGTLFLDEVGDMSAKMQAKILRVLEDGRFQRVGGSQTIDVDLRVIAATNKDLKVSIRSGEFREDLFYRLNVIPVVVPPLRSRKEDIPRLVQRFLRRYSGGKTRCISEATMNFLQTYPWPGNVRELKNWVERACILSTSETLDLVGFEESSAVTSGAEGSDLDGATEVTWAEAKGFREARSAFEKRFIIRMLAENSGNVSRTAQTIGLERSYLHKKMKAYGIEVSGNQC